MERNRRKTRVGIVTSDKMDKTIVVATEEIVRHPLYGKGVWRQDLCPRTRDGDLSRSLRKLSKEAADYDTDRK